MRLLGVRVARVSMPLVRPFRTSFGVQEAREVLLVAVECEVDGSVVEGWGECAAHAEPLYNEEFTEAADLVLRGWLVPAVASLGDSLSADAVSAACAHVKGYRAAKAGLEMALLDAELRAAGQPLSRRLGGTRTAVEVGVSVGIAPTVGELVEQVAGYVAEGYGRVKLKVMPGWDLEPVGAVRGEFPSLPLQVDANAGYDHGDPAHVEQVAALDRFGLLMIEQPFGPDFLDAHASLARSIGTPVCLDESILSVHHAVHAVESGACSIVNIKVGRVGGVLESVRIHGACRDRDVPVWCGGMLETGVGRAANVALASLPGFGFPADLSASDRYWRRDITEPFALVPGTSSIAVPSGPGLGVTVDAGALADMGACIDRVWTAGDGTTRWSST
ncbi:MAG: o-succinylbenzoate synthase [Ilumatobacteraceae bacterium]